MSEDRRRSGPFGLLRELAVEVQRSVAEETAASAVRGAADGLREEMPELDARVRQLLTDAVILLGSRVHEAAQRAPGSPNGAAHDIAQMITRGALDELERQWHSGGLPLHAILERVNELMARLSTFAASRAEQLSNPDRQFETVAGAAVRGLMNELHTALPKILEDLDAVAPVAEDISARAAQGALRGLEATLRQKPEMFDQVVEQAGRALMKGLATGLGTEAFSRSVSHAAEETGRSLVRGLAPELEGAGRAFVRGIVSGLGEAVRPLSRGPGLAAAGATSAVLIAAAWALGRGRSRRR